MWLQGEKINTSHQISVETTIYPPLWQMAWHHLDISSILKVSYWDSTQSGPFLYFCTLAVLHTTHLMERALSPPPVISWEILIISSDSSSKFCSEKSKHGSAVHLRLRLMHDISIRLLWPKCDRSALVYCERFRMRMTWVVRMPVCVYFNLPCVRFVLQVGSKQLRGADGRSRQRFCILKKTDCLLFAWGLYTRIQTIQLHTQLSLLFQNPWLVELSPNFLNRHGKFSSHNFYESSGIM